MKGLPVLLMLFAFTRVLAQQQELNLDHLMKKRIIRCDEIAVNCKSLIPRFYRENKTDSLGLVLQYWKNRCGGTESHARMKVLLDLKSGKFSPDHYGHDLYAMLSDFRSHADWQQIVARWPRPYSNENEMLYVQQIEQTDKAFDLFTENVADEIRGQYPEGSLESLICEFYSGNFEPLYRALQSNRFSGTALKAAYDAEVAGADRSGDGHLAFFGGAWIPTDSLARLGNHPLLGGTLGWARKRVGIDLTLAFAFMRSGDRYIVYDADGNLHESDYFVEMLLAIEPSYNLLREGMRSALLVTGGLGLDRITVVPADEEEDEPGVGIGTLGLSAGLGYRYFLNEETGSYIGVQGRYHFLDFFTRGGTNLEGNALSIRISYGFVGRSRRQALERLYAR